MGLSLQETQVTCAHNLTDWDFVVLPRRPTGVGDSLPLQEKELLNLVLQVGKAAWEGTAWVDRRDSGQPHPAQGCRALQTCLAQGTEYLVSQKRILCIPGIFKLPFQV